MPPGALVPGNAETGAVFCRCKENSVQAIPCRTQLIPAACPGQPTYASADFSNGCPKGMPTVVSGRRMPGPAMASRAPTACPAISRASLPCLKPLPPNGASGTGSSVPICPAAATGWNASSRQAGSAFALRMMTSSRSFLPTTAAPALSPCVLNRLSPFRCTIQSFWQTCSVEFVTASKFCAEAGRA